MKAKQYIAIHLTEPISRTEIAREVYLHPDYLSHLFKETMHVTLSDYILQEKIRYAKELLASGSVSVTEAGFQAGFSNSSYFGKVFRRYAGCTPKEYRRQFVREEAEE